MKDAKADAVTLPASQPVEIAAAGEARKRALQNYPELGVAGSKMNRDFLAAVEEAKHREPTLLKRSDWPMVLAQRVAPTPTPVPDPYGERPANWAVGLLPTAAKRAIKERLRDPDSFQVRKIGPPARTDYHGEKCWSFLVAYGAKNGFGGYSDAVAKCYMRGSQLVAIEDQ